MTNLPARPDLPPLLLSRGFLSQDQLDEAKKRGAEGPKFAEVVIGLGMITEDQIHFAVSGETGLPYLHLSADMVDRDLARRFSGGALVKHGVVPLFEDAEELSVAMVDPWDQAAHEMLGRVSAKPLNVSIAAKGNVSEILRAILGRQSAEAEATAVAVEDGTGIALVYQQLLGAAAEGARQIHFDSGPEGLRVRFRVGNRLLSKATLPAMMALSVFTRLRVLAGVDPFDLGEYLKPGVRSQLGGKDVEMTFSYAPTAGGGSAVIRIDPVASGAGSRSAAEILGDESLAARIVADLGRAGQLVGLGAPRGIPECAGLGTALLAATAAAGLKVVTLQAASATGVLELPASDRPFAERLASALALAPDVIHLAPRPDELSEALEASVAGPCIMVELGYRRAADVLAQLFSTGESRRALVAATAGTAVAVRAVAQLCESCRTPVDTTEKRQLLGHLEELHASALAEGGWFEAPGCDACKGTGHAGRLLLAERLAVTPRARAALREGRLADAVRLADRDCAELTWVTSGQIGLEELS
ncbi:MAG: hypothetical protein HYY25_01690 [Candidatus Wallbacteria bacterium]|nr:hypothetical protein [Candidatus Wallbacteria bacterium]